MPPKGSSTYDGTIFHAGRGVEMDQKFGKSDDATLTYLINENELLFFERSLW